MRQEHAEHFEGTPDSRHTGERRRVPRVIRSSHSDVLRCTDIAVAAASVWGTEKRAAACRAEA